MRSTCARRSPITCWQSGVVLLAQVGFQQLQAGVEQRHQHRQLLRQRFLGRLVEIVLPEVDHQEFLLAPARQPLGEPAGRVRARAAPDHLLQLDARLHRFHEYQVDHLGHVDAGIQHIHRDGDARQLFVLEVVHQLAAVFGFIRDHPRQVWETAGTSRRRFPATAGHAPGSWQRRSSYRAAARTGP